MKGSKKVTEKDRLKQKPKESKETKRLKTKKKKNCNFCKIGDEYFYVVADEKLRSLEQDNYF